MAQEAPVSIDQYRDQAKRAAESLEGVGYTFTSGDGSIRGIDDLLDQGSENIKVGVPASAGVPAYAVEARSVQNAGGVRISLAAVDASGHRIAMRSVTLDHTGDSAANRLKVEQASSGLSREVRNHFRRGHASLGTKILDALIPSAEAQHSLTPETRAFFGVFMLVLGVGVFSAIVFKIKTMGLARGELAVVELLLAAFGAGLTASGAMTLYGFTQAPAAPSRPSH